MNVNRRLEKLENSKDEDQDETRVKVINIFVDRGRGSELDETWVLKDGKFRRVEDELQTKKG